VKEAKIIQRNGQMLALLMLTEVFLTVLQDMTIDYKKMYLDNFTINHTDTSIKVEILGNIILLNLK
jgi:hypothetical protein